MGHRPQATGNGQLPADRTPEFIDRRDALRLLGAGCVAGAAAGWMEWPEALFGARAPRAAVPLDVPAGGIIRTIRGDLNPNSITGPALMHEHVGTGRPTAGRGG